MPDLSAAPDAAGSASEPDDLGAALEAAYDVHVGGSSPATPDTFASPPAGGNPEPSSSPEGAGGDAGRARGPDGKFVVKPAAAPAPAAAAAPTDPKAAAPGAKPEFKIPEKWPPQVKERLQSMHAANPEHAQFVLEQYEHFRREAAQHSNRVQQQMKVFDDLLAPGRQARALQNMDDTTYVRNLIAAGDVLDKNPEQGLRWLAQRYGIDLQKLANPEAGGQQPEIQPEVRALQEENARIKAYLDSQRQVAEQQSLRAAGDWINQFASQKDAAGALLYPHFDDVIHDIVFVVQQQLTRGEQVNVKAAYDKAVRLNDAIWLKEQAARTKSTEEADKARRLREIEDARKAGFAVSGSGAAASTDVPDDLGAHLARNYDKFVS